MFYTFEHFSPSISKKMWFIRDVIHKRFVKIANREDPDQTASSEAVWSGSALFVYAWGLWWSLQPLTYHQNITRRHYCISWPLQEWGWYLWSKYGKSYKISNTFQFRFSKKMWFIGDVFHKMFVRIWNREDPVQTASSDVADSGLHCLFRPFWLATSVRNFKKFTVWCTI